MTMKKVVMGLVSITMGLGVSLFLARATTPPGPIQLKKISNFTADCSGTFITPDTGPQTAMCKGRFIGDDASLTFTLHNIGMVGLGAANMPPDSFNCAFKAGTATITVPDEDTSTTNTINLQLGGAGCASNGSTGTPGSFAEAYWLNGGTGPFANSYGTGSFSVGFDPNSSYNYLLVHIEGSITGLAKEGER
jgi:hypothetical protein